VPVVIVIAIVVVLAVVVFVAAGRGGGMPAAERTDYAPLELGPVSATDIVLLRPPTALWGYSQQATDEALERIADSVRERDVRIVALEQLVTDLSREPTAPLPLSSPYGRARHARPGIAPDPAAGDPAATVPTATVPTATAGGATGPATIPPATRPAGTIPNPIQHVAFGPRPYSMGMPAPEQDTPGDLPAADTGPLAAPVEDIIEPGRTSHDAPPWEGDAGGPPEASHG
jgi:hypothetical protein